ncbi:hypothetical protein TSAR_010658 [Trichomalopsis sarcophagae]|uniref:Uncharacterized protein n=1 Tax=Trichomalopsis sarcophagae TaxID=543379 RepID=A0A232EIA8_9HYME|nr:hypothetical protein TSAR_010658 [Trichomalopsis sarcophagae]
MICWNTYSQVKNWRKAPSLIFLVHILHSQKYPLEPRGTNLKYVPTNKNLFEPKKPIIGAGQISVHKAEPDIN